MFLFEDIAKKSGVQASTVAAFLTETLKALKREGIQIEAVSEEQIKAIFQAVGSGELAKEALPEVYTLALKERRQNGAGRNSRFGFENVHGSRFGADY